MPKILDKVEDFWVNAGQKYKMDELLCPELIIPDPKIGNRYLSCNPLFWQCFWSKGLGDHPELQVEHQGQVLHIEADKINGEDYGRLVSYASLEDGFSPEWAFQVKLKIKEFPTETIHLALLNSCVDQYLPERVYAYGVSQTSRAQDVFLWDNFGRKIYVDRFPVSQREINDWGKIDPRMSHLIRSDVKTWAYPATHLSREEQANYCAQFGSRLMEPHLFDAASMLPSADEKLPEVIAASMTPWERDRSKTFLISEEAPKAEDCKRAAVKGCEIYPYNTNSSSWMGMSDTLGFYPESFRQVYDRFNIKFSSYLLPSTSPWNVLGKRGIWSGEGNRAQDFNTGSIEESPFVEKDFIPVGFRCFREVES